MSNKFVVVNPTLDPSVSGDIEEAYKAGYRWVEGYKSSFFGSSEFIELASLGGILTASLSGKKSIAVAGGVATGAVFIANEIDKLRFRGSVKRLKKIDPAYLISNSVTDSELDRESLKLVRRALSIRSEVIRARSYESSYLLPRPSIDLDSYVWYVASSVRRASQLLRISRLLDDHKSDSAPKVTSVEKAYSQLTNDIENWERRIISSELNKALDQTEITYENLDRLISDIEPQIRPELIR